MRPIQALGTVLLATLGLAACGPGGHHAEEPVPAAPESTVDPNVFPAKAPPFSPGVFPCSRCHVGGEPTVDALPTLAHSAHLEKGLECADCHQPEGEDTEPTIPDAEICQECHEDPSQSSERAQAYFAAALLPDGTRRFPKRWKTQDVDPKHTRHAAAGIACAACHGEASAEPFIKPRSVPLMNACVTCHKERNAPAECATCHTKITEKAHPFELHHAQDQRGCLDCHDPQDRDRLRLANGTRVKFEESYRLCGQCHGPKLRDWKLGLHGKRTGEWNGQREYLLCAHCHNPHEPAFAPMKPLPPPPRPEEIR